MLHPSGALSGSVRASVQDAVPALPFPKGSRQYHDHVIDVLGRLTDYQAGPEHAVRVDMDNVIKPVLKAAGIDPDTHPQVLAGHWKMERGKGHQGLSYQVQRAHRALREDVRSDGLTIQVADMVWGLNERGVEYALKRRREAEADSAWVPLHERNLTEEWFSEHGPVFLAEIAQLAATWDALPDNARELVSEFLVQKVEVDGFREDLERGKLPTTLKVLDMVVDLPEEPELPTPLPMFDSVVRVLCRRTKFRAGGVVNPNPDLYDEVLRDFGIDPVAHPYIVHGFWTLKGKPGLYRQVTLAMRQMADTRETCPDCGTEAQTTETCVCGTSLELSNKNSPALTTYLRTDGKRSKWTLTPKGVAHGLGMKCPDQKGLTEHWLASRPQMVCSLHHLVKAKFRRLSKDRIAHLITKFLGNLRKENTFGARLAIGSPPSEDEFLELCFEFVSEASSQTNATAAWFSVDAERKIACIRKRLAGHLAKSRNLGEIEDLINDYVSNAIRLDSIAKWMASHPGRNVTDRMVANWALKRAYSKFRDAAKDCHQREFRDARTKDERDVYEIAHSESADPNARAEARNQLAKMAAEHSEASSYTPVHLVIGQKGTQDFMASKVASGSAPLVDAVDSFAISEEQIIHNIDRERGFSMIEDAIRRQKPGAPERYVGIFRAVFEDDKSTREIAKSEHVRRNRAASLTQDMRNAIRSSVVDSEQAHSILSYVGEEPFSTERDLHTDLGFDMAVVVKLLGWMSKSGWLEERFDEAKSKAESSYLLTTRGEAILREAQDPELRDSLLNRFLV